MHCKARYKQATKNNNYNSQSKNQYDGMKIIITAGAIFVLIWISFDWLDAPFYYKQCMKT